jgi:hypothetical protein
MALRPSMNLSGHGLEVNIQNMKIMNKVEKLLIRLRESDIKDPISSEFSPTFYRAVDRHDYSTQYVRPFHNA